MTTQHITRDLGLSGRNVRQILLHDRPQIVGAVTSNELLGQYNSSAFNVPDAYNWRINDNTIYSREVRLEARKANQLSHCFGTPINCLAAEYSTDPLTNKQLANQPINNDVLSDSTFEGQAMDTASGQMHFEGVDLSTSPLNIPNTGLRVGQKPVEHLRTIYRTVQNNTPRVLTYFSTVERTFVLRNGLLSVSA